MVHIHASRPRSSGRAGPGPRLESFLGRTGMDASVQLPGAVSRPAVAASLAGADLYVAPARLESFGIAALEARCAGLRVLAMAGAGMEEFVTDGKEGWLVDCDDRMEDKIVELAADREQLLAAARHNRTCPPGISWSSVLRTCGQLYAEAGVRQFRAPSAPPVNLYRTITAVP